MKDKLINSILKILLIIIIGLFLLIFGKLCLLPKEIGDELYMAEEEMCYSRVEEELIIEVEEYIKKVAPSSKLTPSLLVGACEEYNVDICFVLAQGEIESHFGTKGMASKTNSVWNIGAWDNLALAKVKKYSHPDRSIYPYLITLKTKYMSEGKLEEDLMYNFVSVDGHRYASDTSYESKLRAKYKFIKENTNIYMLQEELRW